MYLRLNKISSSSFYDVGQRKSILTVLKKNWGVVNNGGIVIDAYVHKTFYFYCLLGCQA